MHGHMNIKFVQDPCSQQDYVLKDGMEIIFKLHFLYYIEA